MPHNAPLFRSFTSAFRSFSLLPGEFYVKRDIPLGLLAAQQRDVNYDLCSLYFFSPFSSFSLSLCLSVCLSVSISFVFALVEKYVCQQELFHRVHSALALLCTRSWSLTQLTLFCHVLRHFVSNSCLTAIPLIAFQFEIRGNSRWYLTDVNNHEYNATI